GVLKAGCVNRGVFRQTEHKRLARDFEIDPGIIVAVGDVLVSRACGSPELVGSVGRVQELEYQLILSDKTFRPRFRDSVDVDFMVYAMNSRYYRTQVGAGDQWR
ncbi:MAG: restriction endonuclease subunit S, partial [Verrucomicrobia bacterium]|nr:restriction endonuclease subunit S [Verrucomicrobiota bacterium]